MPDELSPDQRDDIFLWNFLGKLPEKLVVTEIKEAAYGRMMQRRERNVCGRQRQLP